MPACPDDRAPILRDRTPPRVDIFQRKAAAVLQSNAARGTQDVNDPGRPAGRVVRPYTGSFTSWVPFPR
jgi:hypothetical protein